MITFPFGRHKCAPIFEPTAFTLSPMEAPSPLRNLSSPALTLPSLTGKLETSSCSLSSLRLSPKILAKVVQCQTAAQAWSILHNLYAAKSTAQVIQVRRKLVSLKKGGDSISDYFDKAKSLSSMLDSAGHPIPDEEFNTYLLAGLPPEFDAIVTTLSAHGALPPPDEVLAHLLVQEARITDQISQVQPSVNNTSSSAPSESPPEANHTSGGRGRGRGRHPSGSYRGRGRGPPNSGGRGPPFFTGAPDGRPTCQICGKQGHSALKCWSRFDQAYQAPPPANFQANATSSWFPDTAATHHFTPDVSNLRINNYHYDGTDTVSLGDGSQIPIQNRGTGSISSSQRYQDQSSASWGARSGWSV